MNPSYPSSLRRLVQGLLLALLAFWVVPAWAQSYIYYSQQLVQSDGYVYIGRSTLDGVTQNQRWLRTRNSPAGIAVDTVNGLIYWAHESGQTIGRAPLSISSPTDGAINLAWIDTRGGTASGGTASFANGVMTLTKAPTTGSIKIEQTVTATGVDPTTVITALLSGNLNEVGSTYSLRDSSTIGAEASFATNVMTLTKAPTDGSIQIGQIVIATGVAPGSRIVALTSGTLDQAGSTYTLSTYPGTIASHAISTYVPVTVASEAITTSFTNSRPLGVAVDATYLYWTESPEPAAPASPRVCRVPLNNTTDHTDVPWIYLPKGSAPWQIVADGTYVYWAEQFLQANLGNLCKAVVGVPAGTPGSRTVLLPGLNDPTGVAVNSAYIYWGSLNNHSVNICDLNGNPVLAATHFPVVFSGADPQIYALACNNNVFYGGVEIGVINPFTGAVNRGLVTPWVDSSHPIYGMAITGAGTVITLTSFKAMPAATLVVVGWTTGSEVDTAGFNIWRSSAATGSFTKANAAVIPAQGTGVGGASYTWTDTNVSAGQTWYYKLEDIDTHSVSTLHGPVSATVGATSSILSFQATPPDIFLGGSSFLSWTVNGSPALSISGIGPVSASSLWVTPQTSTSYTLTDGLGDQSLATVNVKPFGLLDMPGLSKAWGSSKGDANYNPSYDLNGDGKVDDADVALCLKSL